MGDRANRGKWWPGKFRPRGDGPVIIQHDSRGQTRGNSGETSASPSFSVSSGNGGEVTPPRSAKVASSPTQRAEKTRRARGRIAPRAVQRPVMKGDGISRLQRPANNIVIVLMRINIRQLFKTAVCVKL